VSFTRKEFPRIQRTNCWIQESNSLPERLHNWLTSPARHIPTLQVALGSGDEYFASHRSGKISSRDISQVEEGLESNTDFARGKVKRGKAHSISSFLPRDRRSLISTEQPNMKLTRRRTFKGFPSVPLIIGTSVESASADHTLEETRSSPSLEKAKDWKPRSNTSRAEEKPPFDEDDYKERKLGVVDRSKEVELGAILPSTRPGTDGCTEHHQEKTHNGVIDRGKLVYAEAGTDVPKKHVVVIGSRLEFLRVQRSLGDALGYM
jgi:hypothetical protein